jgi:Domain of unknown function (DUF4136)
MRTATLATSVCLTLLGTIALAQTVTYDYDRAANFSTFRTYAWTRGTELPDELNHARIVRAVDAQRAAKGLTKVDPAANPHVLVAYHASFDTNLQIDGFSSGLGPPFGWGNRSGRARVHEVLVGTLVVDVIDAGAHAIVWRGTATSDIDPNAKPEQRDKKIARATERMFRNFPPKP